MTTRKQCNLYTTELLTHKGCDSMQCKLKYHKNHNMEMGRRHKVSLIAKEVLTNDQCWKKETQFSLRMYSLASCSGSSQWSYIQEFIGSTIGLDDFVFNVIKLDMSRDGWILE